MFPLILLVLGGYSIFIIISFNQFTHPLILTNLNK